MVLMITKCRRNELIESSDRCGDGAIGAGIISTGCNTGGIDTSTNAGGIDSGDGSIGTGTCDNPRDPTIPPANFAIVEDRIYRSGFPKPLNFRFLETLQLRSIIYLCPEPYLDENLEFLKAHDILLFQFGIDGTKELSTDVLRNIITEVLKLLIDVRIHPVLIHCKQGKVQILVSLKIAYLVKSYDQRGTALATPMD
ncbi:hypothetical protein R6Q57_002951 [Mikania cordata]